MGEYRAINSEQKKTEVPLETTKSFGITVKELWLVWSEFASRKLNNHNDFDIIMEMKSKPEKFNPKALDCFSAIGLTLFSKEVMDQMEVDELGQKELDFGG